MDRRARASSSRWPASLHWQFEGGRLLLDLLCILLSLFLRCRPLKTSVRTGRGVDTMRSGGGSKTMRTSKKILNTTAIPLLNNIL